ncbi:Hypothetical predicted protein [Lecanosticta acicola]|uniref:Uncharacterized protein n=1 Tax=Lecanosticta acicola TaxID=111012 RepID=A0AAI9E8K9_9PEZI|nr:Hypothetical predicted protein [Lecanosticta acicola]
MNVPSQLVCSPAYNNNSHGRSSVPPKSATNVGTVRTAELLESFPAPPQQTNAEGCDNETVRPPRSRPAWSLFPSTNRRSPLPWQFDPVSRLRKRYANQSVDGSADRNADESAVSAGYVRGEAQSRYRHSGTPLYDAERASLCSFDRDQQERRGGGGDGARASLALGTRALQHRASENDRAVSNGAHRFSSTSRPPTSPRQIVVDGNTFTLCTPDNTQRQLDHEVQKPQVCRHRQAKLQKRTVRYPVTGLDRLANSALFDGSASSPTEPGIATADHCTPAPTEAPSSSNPPPAPPPPEITRLSLTPTTAQTLDSAPSGTTSTSTSNPTTEPMAHVSRQIPLRTATLQTATTMPGRA